MLAKIFIKRRFRAAKAREVIALLTKLRSAAMRQPGYISGETLTNYANQQDLCVIATWQSMEEWLQWKENPERKKTRGHARNLSVVTDCVRRVFPGNTFSNNQIIMRASQLTGFFDGAILCPPALISLGTSTQIHTSQ
jgi:heme-degrading monooxygenase HmoA